jgi:hypothetical protein
MMIHKVNGFDFVVADLMPRLLKLEASLKDDELKAKAAWKQIKLKKLKLLKIIALERGYDNTVSRVLKGAACVAILYFGFPLL